MPDWRLDIGGGVYIGGSCPRCVPPTLCPACCGRLWDWFLDETIPTKLEWVPPEEVARAAQARKASEGSWRERLKRGRR